MSPHFIPNKVLVLVGVVMSRVWNVTSLCFIPRSHIPTRSSVSPSVCDQKLPSPDNILTAWCWVWMQQPQSLSLSPSLSLGLSPSLSHHSPFISWASRRGPTGRFGAEVLHVLIQARPRNQTLVKRSEEPLWREKKKDCHTGAACEPAHSRSHYSSDSPPLFCASLICRNEPSFPPR